MPYVSATPAEDALERGRATFYQQHNPELAQVEFQSSLALGIEGEAREECLIFLGEAFWANKEIDKAMTAFDREIRTGRSVTHRPRAMLRKAMAHMAKGEDRLGMDTYAQLVKEYPSHPLAASSLMVQANFELLKRGDLSRAIQLYEVIASRYPSSEEAKAALVWLPHLRQSDSRQIRKQLRDLEIRNNTKAGNLSK